MARPRIGELLVEAKVLTREQLEQALELQRTDGRKLGLILTQLGVVTETQLTQTLGRQLSVPWVSLYHIDFSRQLLNLVSREIAERFCLVPIYVRRVRKQGETLYVAMDDPTNEGALAECAKASSLPVRPMIACPSDIRAAIRVYYGGGSGTEPPVRDAPPAGAPAEAAADSVANQGSRSASTSAPISLPATGAATGPEGAERDALPEEEKDSPDAWPEVEAHTLVPRPKGGPRMIALTLLDGTEIVLPARPARAGAPDAPSGAPGELTARDFIRALRAVAHGKDASEILGEKVPIEAMCAAILSVLLKKGLVADWEFVEELRKM